METPVLNQLSPRLRGLLGTDSAPAVVTADPAIHTADQLATGVPYLALEPGLDLAGLQAAIAAYRAAHGANPEAALVAGVAAMGVGPTRAAADAALARLAGTTAMPTPDAPLGRLAGKVAMVTGAAQGFGLGIAEQLLTHGASVILADLNIEGARSHAARLTAEHGPGRADAVRIDVSDPDSCQEAVAEAVVRYGGVDVFVSNAGVLRAEGVMTQPVADFDLVTNVNYRGYFLCVRAIAPVMAAQHEAAPDSWLDIVEINSKSGLEGSKRNFAYAGSKFGGIGLTQSFALELVEDGIKVNALCPGNFLDGPLWSDPERGLFVQYLRAGKVPGATTVADVRRFYEAKVPMGRGALPTDVAKALLYVVEQTYETGQAVPITGGQNMLS